jgi:hypothetical protein
MADELSAILADLTGQAIPFERDCEHAAGRLLKGSGLAYSQLNELLLLLEYDRVSPRFFQFLLDEDASCSANAAFKTLDQLRLGVDRFRRLAILRFGNVKFGFKYFSAPSTDLEAELALISPVDTSEFAQRHDPLLPIDPIPGDQTYFLGYLIKRQLDDRLRKHPDDENAKAQLEQREQVIEKGRRNQEAYLASDHMDVYVATSMRERHEYQMINEVVKDVFGSALLRDLRLRWFDPTQAFCEDRVDKGLTEGLMLRRAACTLYLAQESDTLGKDSELASTLAQGKPVVAYIPSVTESGMIEYVEQLLATIARGAPGFDPSELVLQQLRVFWPEGAWQDREVMGWLADRGSMDLAAAKRRLGERICTHYDTRARTLKQSHPLGLQVHLETGVAMGVLVARSTEQCADLIRRILTRTLDFEICEQMLGKDRYLFLKEKITGSVFRVVSGDRFLTNTFWNFYLNR